ncbi:hydrogenase maturation nickel metallochaperone HypA [Desulfococcus multivorans]|uniref:Hydrogenase maturation factor HypA n=2 Tax=Desulfococcus multivorans TaxID=897 RepID=S7V697_DESML|nr:hydrogenase maturation nickel metallochaperone HypA [Desulfococcus multivorans]AOY60187.1 HypA: predicted hydrogenase nickel incorporation protein [Desulfococcus multivorans]AQV02315.1 hydrogenase maturation nickel metallochaperone HypA [Desulfococcus multivorans]EPR42169.1 hydrogenase nickel incorporation protein hypA [Desulfococcus multivorans DSM 2059]SKA06499.1 hydrogenase nickel incorporation protein HypA/HybF [Desulfococcus multivorans DSM 2059]
MHEMGIAMQIAEIAAAAIPADMAGKRVERVRLRVGRLSAVVSASLRFCFDVVARDTPLANAVLDIEEIPVTAVCDDCGHQWTADQPHFICPRCNGGAVRILSGRELEVTAIEIEE